MVRGVKLTGFKGEMPATAPELLPEMHAQEARNCKLRSGHLMPMKALAVVGTMSTTATRSLYALSDGIGGKNWLSWDTAVKVVPHPQGADTDQRFFYTGDGVPKVSTASLAYPVGRTTIGPPSAAYDLGLPLPDTVLSAASAPVGGVAVASVAWDKATSTATYTTSVPHGFSDGQFVSVEGIGDKSGTYSISAGVATITIPDHGLVGGLGSWAPLLITSGSMPSGKYNSPVVVDANTFTVAVSSGTGSGTVDLSMSVFNVAHKAISVVDASTFTVAALSAFGVVASATAFAAATAIPDVSIAKISRDSDRVVYYCAAPHGFREGAYVTIRGMQDKTGSYAVTGETANISMQAHGLSLGSSVPLMATSGTMRSQYYTVISVYDEDSFSVSVPSGTTGGTLTLPMDSMRVVNAAITVIDDKTFSAYSPGFSLSVSSGVMSGVTAALAGPEAARNYLYTWVTPWDEESIGAVPTADVLAKETESVRLSAIPTVAPAGNNFIKGVRLYRATSGGEYMRLATAWFPAPVSAVGRSAGIATITMSYEHGLVIGDRVLIDGAVAAALGVTDLVVATVDSNFIFTAAAAGADIASGATSGYLYHDVAENTQRPAVYWGVAGDYDFIDDFLTADLTTALATDEYDAPPANLAGLVAANNDMLAGFVGSTVYFSEPGAQHAWPIAGAVDLSSEIVALAMFNSALFVATKGNPYVISGTSPRNLTVSMLDMHAPCVSAGSLVVSDLSIIYATYKGLASFSQVSGMRIITEAVYDADSWAAIPDLSNMVSAVFEGFYVASTGSVAFVFAPDKTGGELVQSDILFNAVFQDYATGALFMASGATLSQYDVPTSGDLSYTWRSKKSVLAAPMNLGAMRVEADFSTGVRVEVLADGVHRFSAIVYDNSVVRLPSGFRAVSYEVTLSGTDPVHAVYMAETPIGLREI